MSEEHPNGFKPMLTQPGILSAFEIVPPELGSSEEQVQDSTHTFFTKLGTTINSIDAFLLPDMDPNEVGSDGTTKSYRKPTLESSDFAKYLNSTSPVKQSAVTTIPFRRTVKSEDNAEWLQSIYYDGLSNIVFAGGHSRNVSYSGPSPTEFVEIAYGLDLSDLVIGGLCIPTRGRILRNGYTEPDLEREPRTLLKKQKAGMGMFVTQYIGEAENIIGVAERYIDLCNEQSFKPNPIIMGFSPVMGERNLNFLEWLGVYYPEEIKKNLFESDTGVVDRSIDNSVRIFEKMLNYVSSKINKIPIGFYVGGTAVKHLGASVELFGRLNEVARQYEK
jgi:5,10-methylenetetrahydrofolate reductase